MQKTGSEIICEVLIAEGVREIFGYPGGAILPLYDTLPRYARRLRHILTRHEQGAAFAAEGYARASGGAGVCLATSGPGATNLITAIADSHLDSTPLVVITGQVFSHLLGTDAFQEADIVGLTLPITKHNYLVTRAADLPRVLKEAFFLARSGRPGPVLVDVTKDAQAGLAPFPDYQKVKMRLPGYRLPRPAAVGQIAHAARILNAAERPVVIVGRGVLLSRTEKQVLQLAQKLDAAIVTTLLGISAIPAGTPHFLGMLGMHGHVRANHAAAHADVLLGIGMRFDDRITGKVSEFARHAKVVHLESDPAELHKIIPAEAPVLGCLSDSLPRLLSQIKTQKHAAWHAAIASHAEEKVAATKKPAKKETRLRAVEVVHAVAAAAPDAFIVSDVGQNQMWAAMHFPFKTPGRYLASGGLGSMGFGLPAALGAKVAHPKKSVWCLTGDGGLQMNMQELVTLAQDKIAVKIAVFNNGFLGMVRQWQELFYGKNYSATPLLNPDFQLLARACGLASYRVERPEDALKITKMAEAEPGPTLVEYLVTHEENVFPMVEPGAALSHTRVG